MAYQKQVYKKRYSQGVPQGYSHNWKYEGQWKETKFAPKKWKFRFRASKSRGGSAIGGLPIGSRVLWKINALQGARKVSGRKYMTDMIGIKKLIAVKPARRFGKYKRY